MPIKAKICGVKTVEAIEAAEEGGASFIGFIFHPPSSRYIDPSEAGILALNVRTAKKVAVVVNATNQLLNEIINNIHPDYIQLHGKETDARAEIIKDKFNIPLIRFAAPNTMPSKPNLYDYLLFDSPKGGSGIPFDWKKFTPPKNSEWFLSGGLNLENVEEAVNATGAKFVDVSSGVESSLGVKDVGKIKAFLEKVRNLN